MAKEKQPQAARIALEQDLVIKNGLACRALLRDAVAAHSSVLVDLKQVFDCDTAGLQLLIALRKSAKGRNVEVRLCNVPAVVAKTATQYGFNLEELFVIEQGVSP